MVSPTFSFLLGKIQVLIYLLLWNTGWYNNQEIGNLFGLGYSSISRRVTIMKSMISKDDEIHKQFEEIKSLIKVCPPPTSSFAPVLMLFFLILFSRKKENPKGVIG